MPQTRKAFLVTVGNITLGVVTKSHPTKSEVKLQLEHALNQELNQVRLATSGWVQFENIKKKENEIKEAYIYAYGCVLNNNYKVKFLQEVKL